MTSSQPGAYLKSDLFHSTNQLLQQGDVKAALENLERLVQMYPYETDLQTLQQTAKIQARMDRYESVEKQILALRWLLVFLVRLAVAAAIIVVLLWGMSSSLAWINAQGSSAMDKMQENLQALKIASLFQDAYNFLQAEQPEKAKTLFLELKELEPDYPNLETYITEADSLIELDVKYQQALQFMENGDASTAYALWTEIASVRPLYRDVKQRIADIEKSSLLTSLYAQAAAAFDAGKWVDAIDAYETLRSVAPQFESAAVEKGLFTSYINRGKEILDDPLATEESLAQADDYFRKALSLRPRDKAVDVARGTSSVSARRRMADQYMEQARQVIAEQPESVDAIQAAEDLYNKALFLLPEDEIILLQRNLAKQYILALDSFNKMAWNEAVISLEFIYSNDPKYAGGTALQLLYDANLARGKEQLASSNYSAALTDFQRAAVLAEQSTDPKSLLHEAQLRIAYTLGMFRSYEDAVLTYLTVVDALDPASLTKPEFVAALDKAKDYADKKDYVNAYLNYREIFRTQEDVYDLAVHVVKKGDYLGVIARKYNTTVAAILQVNHIVNPNDIYLGQELLIPTLP